MHNRVSQNVLLWWRGTWYPKEGKFPTESGEGLAKRDFEWIIWSPADWSPVSANSAEQTQIYKLEMLSTEWIISTCQSCPPISKVSFLSLLFVHVHFEHSQKIHTFYQELWRNSG